MIRTEIYETEEEFLKQHTKESYIDFLHTHLERFGDEKEAIGLCLDYAFEKNCGKGGFAAAAYDGDELVGALIMNKTGMSGYIPENILVYVAVNGEKRGKGIGKTLINACLDHAGGDVKLHVEYDNPAKRLYERIGFTTKYAEMRYKK